MSERDEFEEDKEEIKKKKKKRKKKVMKKITSSSTLTKPLITLAVLPEIEHKLSVAVAKLWI
jgi:hypothetical protein